MIGVLFQTDPMTQSYLRLMKASLTNPASLFCCNYANIGLTLVKFLTMKADIGVNYDKIFYKIG
jgi:hypothetical protein